MMKHLPLIYVLLIAFVFGLCSIAGAKKAVAPPSVAWPSASEQQAFTESYYQALDGGGKAFHDFETGVAWDNSPEAALKSKMLENLKKGKTADGSGERKGFRGDPNDPGPQDWSDYIIETDADGNVTGFKDKDHYQKDSDGDGQVTEQEAQDYEKKRADEFMDKDGDGNVSDQEKRDAAKEMDSNQDGKVDEEERERWNDGKAEAKEIADNGGQAPGEVDTPPDWDKDGDGKPDADFMRDCWQCKQLPQLHECVDGAPGPCDGHSCDQEEECVEHTETYEKQDLVCHNCIPTEKIVQFCEDKGFYTSGTCNGDCDPGDMCVAIDVDIKSGGIIPKMQTRERGSTQPCFICRKIVTIEITYVVIIIETPRMRIILNETPGLEGFIPSQVMALSKVTATPDGVQQIAGMMPGNIGSAFGMLNIAKSMSLPDVANLLQQGLASGGKYSDDCFSKDFSEEDFSDDTQPPPSSSPDPKSKSDKKNKSVQEPHVPSQNQGGQSEFGQDPAQDLTMGGPVVACGQQGKEKVLAVMDASGRPVEMITKAMLMKNPNAVTEAMQKAQEISDVVMSIRQQGIEGFLQQKAKAFAQKLVDKMTKKAVERVAEKIGVGEKKKDKKKKDEEKPQVVPNDPYYQEPTEKEKKKLLGILGGDAPPPVVIGSMMKVGTGGTLGATETRKEEVVKYQWGLHDVGYAPLSDSNSAWNFVNAQDKNVVVAVIDSGIDLNHPDGPQHIWNNPNETAGNGKDDDNNGYVDDVHGWNFLDNNSDLTDLQGHGSFVSGIIASRWNNGMGIAGINPGAVIMPIKVADAEGETNSFHIFRAIYYAVDNGAKIINISLGSRGISELERKALNYADQMGVFVAVASGNVGENIAGHGPASSGGAFSVGATDMEGTRSTISNWGPNNALLAPGDRIVSLLASGTGRGLRKSLQEEGYYPQSGTSFSTPIVAATASLLLVQNPQYTPDEIEDILQRSADEMYTDGWDGKSGAGKLNASAALQNIVQRDVTLKIAETRFNYNDNKKISSVDIFGTVRGKFTSFVVELGKGEHAGKFIQVAGPYTNAADHSWLARLERSEVLKGSDEWVLRIRATALDGSEHIAQTLLELK
jgi:subtilisin family serine protease